MKFKLKQNYKYSQWFAMENIRSEQKERGPYPQQKTNFLFDVIMPNIYDVDNIKLIQKHFSNPKNFSPVNNVREIQKKKLQTVVSSVVRKQSKLQESHQGSVGVSPKLKKFKPQSMHFKSDFQKGYDFKKQLFESGEVSFVRSLSKSTFAISGSNLDIATDLKNSSYHSPETPEKNCTDRQRIKSSRRENSGNSKAHPQKKHSNEKEETQHQKHRNSSKASRELKVKQQLSESCEDLNAETGVESGLFVEFDEEIGQKRKMEGELFEPFRQKVAKVIEKTLRLGVNGSENQLEAKVNHYIEGISDRINQVRYCRAIANSKVVDSKFLNTSDHKARSTSANRDDTNPNQQQLSLQATKSQLIKSGFQSSASKQYRKSATPLTRQSNNSQSQLRIRSTYENEAPMTMRRFASSASAENNLHRTSRNITEKQLCENLLSHIQGEVFELQRSKSAVKNKLKIMEKAWNLDSSGKKSLSKNQFSLNKETLVLIQQKRTKADQKQQIDKYATQ